MRRWVKWIVGIVAVGLVAYAVGGTIILRTLLTPGGVDWSGANNPNPPTDPLTLNYRGDPRTAFGYDFETVHYRTELGDAEAWLVPAAEPSTLWAVYVHGIGGIRENGYKQLSVLHEAGLPTLLITYRNDAGAPASGNRLYSFGLTEWRDLDAAVSWMKARGAQKIVLVAESMGGAIAGQFLMHSEQTASIAALALDAPALDFLGLVADLLARRHLPFPHWTAAMWTWAIGLLNGTDLGAANGMAAVDAFPAPLFIAHGTGDLLVPVSIADAVAAGRSAPTTLLRTGAAHLQSFAEDPERYRSEFLAFLDTIPR